jgi:oxidoreductase
MGESENPTSDMERFKALGQTAFVMGYTGLAGAALVRELNRTKIFKKVILIGRRVVTSLDVGPEFEQRVVDYEKLDEHKDAFKDADIGYCCMGAHSKDVTKEQLVRINRDFTVKSAQIAKENGCKQFTIITSKGSNKTSMLHALKVKGELEEKLEELHFDRLSIFRPAHIIKNGEIPTLLKPINFFFANAWSIHDYTFAKAMVNNTVSPPTTAAKQIFENKDIHQLGEDK